jgi:transmembrane sensor
MKGANNIPEDAATWLVRLEAQTTPEMWDEFQAWLTTDTRHEAAFIRLRTAWTHCDQLKLLRPKDGRADRDLLGQFDTALSGRKESQRSGRNSSWEGRPSIQLSRRQWLIAAGSTAIAGAGASWFASLSREHTGWTHYETEIGCSRKDVLTDHSSVLLNTDSRLRVRLVAARRDSELIRGEALFTVAHDELRPFYVKAAGALVRALGTSFSVRIHDDRSVEVLVTEGRVSVGAVGSRTYSSALGNPVPGATANDIVTVSADTVVLKHQSPDYIARKLAWTSGRISFDGETLVEAVREFNRYNHQHLAIADPAIAQVRVGGLFDATDPESFAATLEKHFGVRRMPAVLGDNDVIRLVNSGQRITPRT